MVGFVLFIKFTLKNNRTLACKVRLKTEILY